MTLQQLRYLIAIAEYGSINAAANNMYASQSNLSTAVQDLESELGITIFTRSNRGVTLTNDGTELLGYARQVVEQADMLEERYVSDSGRRSARLAVSSQHYHFTVQAFTLTCEEFSDGEDGSEEYDFVLRECATGQIIEDVRTFRSEIGILYLDDFNSRVLSRAFEEANVAFTQLFEAQPHVFVGAHHALAGRDSLTFDDLEAYPRYSFEQGTNNSFYYAEEPFAALPHKRNIRYSDRGTLTNLLMHYDGYTLSTGVLSEEMLSGIVSISLKTDLRMRVGYIMHAERRPSRLLERYIANLHTVIRDNPTVQA